ncbi:unnamed protein product [Nyctereutes procyonoides]|uniref:(raccoon dog) hypothetical protein n=1 Tax=Nyctereutes procyonoides TaxID=34880 RepID=A0A811YEJ1_NYCPR|nr:unnamed protein product [Nyctereutes procyonoides]
MTLVGESELYSTGLGKPALLVSRASLRLRLYGLTSQPSWMCTSLGNCDTSLQVTPRLASPGPRRHIHGGHQISSWHRSPTGWVPNPLHHTPMWPQAAHQNHLCYHHSLGHLPYDRCGASTGQILSHLILTKPSKCPLDSRMGAMKAIINTTHMKAVSSTLRDDPSTKKHIHLSQSIKSWRQKIGAKSRVPQHILRQITGKVRYIIFFPSQLLWGSSGQ